MQVYNSLEAIKTRKTELHNEINASEKNLSALWNATFHAKKIDSTSTTQKLLAYASTASGIIDGVLFGWKLYRKFHK